MNYYNQIKEQLITNEIYKRAKDYSKNRSDLSTYYNVGKLLNGAGKYYGEQIIKKYSTNLTLELGKQYKERTLRRMRQFYLLFNNQKWSTMSTKLSWSHYAELLSITDFDKINYYINITENHNLSVRELKNKIKNKEYERLASKTKEKLINKEKSIVSDFIKNPILIKNGYNHKEISEKILKQLILEDLDNFLCELGEGFTYIKNELIIEFLEQFIK